MSDAPSSAACANCSAVHPLEELDARGWCTACRTEVIARARRVAIAAGLLAGLATLVGVVLLTPSLRIPVVVWVVVAAAVYFVVFRIVRRVAFEIIRGRGVTPTRSPDAG